MEALRTVLGTPEALSKCDLVVAITIASIGC